MTDLFSALAPAPRDMIALVGSGGKTTLMYGLATQAVARGLRVLTTTTTKIFHPEPHQSGLVFLGGEGAELITRLKTGFKDRPHLTAASKPVAGGKLDGLPPAYLDSLFNQHVADLIVVEADGSRRMPLKAPASHEPVIPGRTGLVVMVVGLSGLGRILDVQTVFRPELFASMSGLSLGETITPGAVARVLFHPEGLLKNAPAMARVQCLLNQADAMPEELALETVEEVLAAGKDRLERVILGSLKLPDLGFSVRT